MADFTERRRMMVDTQVRPQDVTKFPIIDAMLSVPRELFVPDSQSEAAYVGDHVEIGRGRVLMDPRTLAKMLDALDFNGDELALDIGSGLGYSAAIVSRLAEAVVAVEDQTDWAEDFPNLMSATQSDNVIVHSGPLAEGAAEHGPYNVILVQGGVGDVPQTLVDQLKDGGRMACVFMEGALGTVRIGHKSGDGMTWRFAFNADAPVIPGFEKALAFSL
ncbi:MAG: protein-L-isoaspartate O-methyltransferase [Rhodobacteraceae bacterium]|nr:protein-L-isoaspartate O-methyltransferase [Paracoccaceae bacterium]